ncbi:5-formyltetrahydrofolate cyclo-ligase [Candidatus Liberibacter asiaticus]|nr:5-formyltetrahydrofolate cyclo-ligase [Candidatus Liberibacter asiaticus]AGH16905.1 5-formyltetrahydrofolate cyclo-ligase [Candidatus Liberibacter asiaticus str. gxpsy]ASK52739.1 5-formyltetrahydrofolate cyclo-ligase [Candidatus Liberibacter asiaticus]KAE9514425.1 putative 5-formyltetrahydrofolate cyclo-ligase [Candidatus Liberibacter asiaticus]KAE9516516.1 putative 5-formyltetrahydrofolate cyclo-ligase [Candidatus Liberibacter asiaticus]KPG62881.1 5-formyltetrahydrofolate cyclo-ligase [Can
MTPREHKNLIRKKKMIARNLLSPAYRHMKSISLADLGAKKIPLKKKTKIATFYPMQSEVNVNILVDKIAHKECSFCLPAITGNTMIFRQYENPTDLVKSAVGTLSPPSYAKEMSPDLILMPLIAFDLKGNRIGYGRGYYDRAIADIRLEGKNPYLLGIAFDMQETSCIQAEATDIRLHAILTESRFSQFSTEHIEKV